MISYNFQFVFGYLNVFFSVWFSLCCCCCCSMRPISLNIYNDNDNDDYDEIIFCRFNNNNNNRIFDKNNNYSIIDMGNEILIESNRMMVITFFFFNHSYWLSIYSLSLSLSFYGGYDQMKSRMNMFFHS